MRHLLSILLLVAVLMPQAAAQFGFSDVAYVGAAGSSEMTLDEYILSLGPTAWYAARKETAYSDTDAVPTATNWSGNGYDATQGTAAYQPTWDEDGLGG